MLNTKRLSLVISVRWLHPFPSTLSMLLRDARIPSGVRLPMFLGLSELEFSKCLVISKGLDQAPQTSEIDESFGRTGTEHAEPQILRMQTVD